MAWCGVNCACLESVHGTNHSARLKSWMSSLNPGLTSTNSESAEQFNSLLRKVSNSLVFRSLDNYLAAVTEFSRFITCDDYKINCQIMIE